MTEIELRPLRSVYGTPWSKLAKGKVPLAVRTMRRLGAMMVKEIVKEARKDFAKQGRKPTPKGEPEGIPKSKDFFKSFHWRLRGSRTIEIYSTWPWIEQIVEGRDKYKMTWLTQPEGIYQVPMKQPNGTVIVRTTPATRRKAWVHPGFAEHNFIERGVDKGRIKAAEIMLEEIVKKMEQGDPKK